MTDQTNEELGSAYHNMQLWDEVCETDPNHTKVVDFGRKFTAIDAHYQIRRATEIFGPVGIGWGYNCEYRFIENFVICELCFWHGSSRHFGPIAGCASFRRLKDGILTGPFDEDAPKKAMTDALTKALSHLGFNADVFEGLFDDNKYVAQMKAKFKPKIDWPTKPDFDHDAFVLMISGDIQSTKSMDELSSIKALYKTGSNGEIMKWMYQNDIVRFENIVKMFDNKAAEYE